VTTLVTMLAQWGWTVEVCSEEMIQSDGSTCWYWSVPEGYRVSGCSGHPRVSCQQLLRALDVIEIWTSHQAAVKM